MTQTPDSARLPAQRSARQHRATRTVARILGRFLLYLLVAVLGLTYAFPLLWMVSTSLKVDAQVYVIPPQWIPNPVRFSNYPEILLRANFGPYFLNTLTYAFPTIVATIVSSSLVAYGFSRFNWPGRNIIFLVCISTMMLPFQVQMIPLYVTFRSLGWMNTYKPLVVPAFFGSAYYIFLLRQFFLTIPQELSDAARVDGCSELMIYGRIVLPLAKPALAVVGLYQFMAAWNDYLGPLIYLAEERLYPISLGLQQIRMASWRETQVWPWLMAATTSVIAPVIIVFYLAQRTFVEGITLTGIKG
ncbi:MAG: carbohydrate ABC transporter permease [Anaerolineae bacterium]